MGPRHTASIVTAALLASITASAQTAEPGRAELEASVARVQPKSWLVLTAGGESSPSSRELFAEYLLAEDSRRPSAGEAAFLDREGPRWTRRESGAASAGILCAYGRVARQEAEVLMARLTGAGLLFVNGVGFVGDRERRGFRGVPIALDAGENELFVLDVDGSFEFELWSPPTRTVVGTWDVRWPAVTRERQSWFPHEIRFPVFNASTREIPYLHVHYGHAAPDDGGEPPHITDWRDGGLLAPLGIFLAASYFGDIFTVPSEPITDATRALVPVHVYAVEEGEDEDYDSIPIEMLSGPLLEPGDRSGPPAFPGREREALQGGMLGERSGRTTKIVYGTRVVDGEVAPDLALARFLQQQIWYRTGSTPTLMTDAQFMRGREPWKPTPGSKLEELLAGRKPQRYSHVILCGTPESNEAWERVVPEAQDIRGWTGGIVTTDDLHPGHVLYGWFRAREWGALVVTYTGPQGARLGYVVDVLGLPAGEEDFAFYDGSALRSAVPAPAWMGTLP